MAFFISHALKTATTCTTAAAVVTTPTSKSKSKSKSKSEPDQQPRLTRRLTHPCIYRALTPILEDGCSHPHASPFSPSGTPVPKRAGEYPQLPFGFRARKRGRSMRAVGRLGDLLLPSSASSPRAGGAMMSHTRFFVASPDTFELSWWRTEAEALASCQTGDLSSRRGLLSVRTVTRCPVRTSSREQRSDSSKGDRTRSCRTNSRADCEYDLSSTRTKPSSGDDEDVSEDDSAECGSGEFAIDVVGTQYAQPNEGMKTQSKCHRPRRLRLTGLQKEDMANVLYMFTGH